MAQAATVVITPGTTRKSKSRRPKADDAGDAASSAWMMGVLWATVAMACAAMIFWALSGRSKPVPAPVNTATTAALQAASTPVVVPAVVAIAPVPAVSAPAIPAVAHPSVAPTQAPVSRHNLSGKTAPRTAPKTLSSETVTRVETPASQDVVVKPVHDAKVEPASAVKETKAQNSSTTYRDLCPDSNFFSRPMCIYRECQKSENARLPVCIEDRKRWENRDKGQ
jgi:non-specific serine/threonine protein kinase